MSPKIKLLLQILAAVSGAVLLGILGTYIWILTSINPIQYKVAQVIPWPVACNTRGCVTTTWWNTQHQLAVAFAEKTEQPVPTLAQSLTTAIRAHLVQHGFLRSPLTREDAAKYREEVLQLKANFQLQHVTNSSLPLYDAYVVLPFLQQEALRQQKSVESTEELYRQLIQERYILFLPFAFRWDSNNGVVEAK